MFGIGLAELLVLLVLLGGTLGALAIWIWTLVDCITHEPPGDGRLTWILLVVLVGFPGALLYLVLRRSKRVAEHGR